MHTISATDGIVLSKRVLGEANTRIALLTEDFGLVRASARSARVERSKLRYGLETLTRGRFSLLRGKYEWKVVGTEHLSRSYLSKTLMGRKASGRVARLLLRLIHGEEPVPLIYTTAKNGFEYLSGQADDADIESLECVLVLRILSHLGYVAETERVLPFVQGSDFTNELVAEARRVRPVLVRAVNEALGSSGL